MGEPFGRFPHARLWFLSSRKERNAPPARRPCETAGGEVQRHRSRIFPSSVACGDTFPQGKAVRAAGTEWRYAGSAVRPQKYSA